MTCELVISGIPEGLLDEELQGLFTLHGTIKDFAVDEGSGGRAALVVFEDAATGAEAQRQMDGHEVLGATLRVTHRQPGEVFRRSSAAATVAEFVADKSWCDLVVQNLPSKWAEEDLRRACEQYGAVKKLIIVEDLGPENRFGLVRYTDSVMAGRAMAQMNNSTCEWKRLFVKALLPEVQAQSAEATAIPKPTSACVAAFQAYWADIAEEAARAAPKPGHQDQMDVPKSAVGVLVSKEGTTLKHVRRESQVHIELSRNVDRLSATRELWMHGPSEAIAKAKKMLRVLLSQAERKPQPDVCYDAIHMSRAVCGMLVGHAGETVSRLSKGTGADLAIIKDDLQPDSRMVVISGGEAEVELAFAEVLEVVIAGEELEAEGLFKTSTEASGFLLVRVGVPAKHVKRLPWLMGEGKLEEVAKEVGVKIKSRKDGAKAILLISGERRKIEEAKRRIDLLWKKEEKKAEPKDIESLLQIHADRMGALLGKSGKQLIELRTATGCKIKIPATKWKDDMRIVRLRGTPEAVFRGREAIKDILGEENVKEAQLDAVPMDKEAPAEIISETIYIDELALPVRAELWKVAQDGQADDIEVFVSGLPVKCTEQELWAHLCKLGVPDVAEVLLLSRQGKSKGMAYIVFHKHESAVLARSKLHDTPTASVVAPLSDKEKTGKGRLSAWLSESERCIKGERGTYRADIVEQLNGKGGANIKKLGRLAGLAEVKLAGPHSESEDPRLHLVVHYKQGRQGSVAKAKAICSRYLADIHKECAERQGILQDGDDTEGPTAPASSSKDPQSRAEGEKMDTESAEVEIVTVLVRERASRHRVQHEVLSGKYWLFGEHQDRPVYQKVVEETDEKEVYLYFLDPSAGDDAPSKCWCFGPIICNEEVFARCLGEASFPPHSGWELSGHGEDLLLLTVQPCSEAALDADTESEDGLKPAGVQHTWAQGSEWKVGPVEAFERRDDAEEAAGREKAPAAPKAAPKKREEAPEEPAEGKKKKKRRREKEQFAGSPPPGQWAMSSSSPWQVVAPNPAAPPPKKLPKPWIAMHYGPTLFFLNQETGERSWYPPDKAGKAKPAPPAPPGPPPMPAVPGPWPTVLPVPGYGWHY